MVAHSDEEDVSYSAWRSLADSLCPRIQLLLFGGGGGLSLVTCLHSLQPCAQSEHTVVLSPTAVVCGSVSGHSALSVISVFRALMCNRL